MLLISLVFSGIKGRETGNEKLVGIIDLQHIGYKNIDARALITGFQFIQVMVSALPSSLLFNVVLYNRRMCDASDKCQDNMHVII